MSGEGPAALHQAFAVVRCGRNLGFISGMLLITVISENCHFLTPNGKTFQNGAVMASFPDFCFNR